MSTNETKILLNVVKKLNDERRIELIDRLIRFNEFSNNLNIKLVKRPKNYIIYMAEYITTGKNLKIRRIYLSLKDKYMAYCFDLLFGIISPFSYVNIETMNIISSDVEANEYEYWTFSVKSAKLINSFKQLGLPHILGFLSNWKKKLK